MSSCGSSPTTLRLGFFSYAMARHNRCNVRMSKIRGPLVGLAAGVVPVYGNRAVAATAPPQRRAGDRRGPLRRLHRSARRGHLSRLWSCCRPFGVIRSVLPIFPAATGHRSRSARTRSRSSSSGCCCRPLRVGRSKLSAAIRDGSALMGGGPGRLLLAVRDRKAVPRLTVRILGVVFVAGSS